MLLVDSKFPAERVNEHSKVEKNTGGRPPHWEMVFWWTRKPLASARAVIAASLLPDDAYQTAEQFLNDLFPCRRKRKTVHACNPAPRLVEKLRGKKLLDPFAGFGSIPLEAARLGLDVTAVELLPTAYVFLKAVLEYPRRWGHLTKTVDAKEAEELGIEKGRVPLLVYDVAKWGKWVVERLKEDPEVKELYDDDAAVYIGTWEVKCPVCGRHTPLVGNWWLARVKGKRGYERLAWMEWRDGAISVKDLNKELKKDEIDAEVKTRREEEEEGGGGSVRTKDGKTYTVPANNVNPRRETAQCLYCKAEIDHRVVNGRLIKADKKVGDWYVKWALRQWNQNYERYLRGEVGLEELLNSPARPVLLVKAKQRDGDLEFEPATPADVEKLWKAAEKLRQIWGDPDIPTEPTPPYENRHFPILYGFNKWYLFFNPRQLLTLTKLVKLIREVGKRVEEEKTREGWNKEDVLTYAEAVLAYLALALLKYADYGSQVASWNQSLIMAHSVSFRGITMVWNWYESKAWTRLTGTFLQNIATATEALSYFVSAHPHSTSVNIFLGDATSLSMNEKFDVIVTDPPYADDVPYSELSDFYYVWLKRTLSDVEGDRLRPRFLSEAFFDEFGEEITTQWQFFAPKEVSEDKGRREYFKSEPFDVLLAKAFTNMLRFLREDGVLAVYYVAKKPEAWFALVKALWEVAGLEMVASYPVATESEESVVARGKASVLGGYVSVWRRRQGERPLDLSAERGRAVAEVVERVKRHLSAAGGSGEHTAWVYTYLAALGYLTEHWPVTYRGVQLDAKGVIGAAVDLAFEALLKRAGVEVSDPVAKAYLALRILENERGRVDSDQLAHVERAVGLTTNDMVKFGLVAPTTAGGPNVAKRKQFEVLAPRDDTVEELRRVYGFQRGKSPVLDCMRQLQLNAVARAPVACSQTAREETLAVAKALVELARAGLLEGDDADVKILRAVLGAEWWV